MTSYPRAERRARKKAAKKAAKKATHPFGDPSLCVSGGCTRPHADNIPLCLEHHIALTKKLGFIE